MKVTLKPASHHSFAKRPERARARSVTAIPPTLSEMLAATTTTATRRPRVCDDPEGLATVDLLSRVESLFSCSPSRTHAPSGHRRSRGRFAVAASCSRTAAAETCRDALPGAVARPLEVIAMDGIPVRVALGKGSPLGNRLPRRKRSRRPPGADRPSPADPSHRGSNTERRDRDEPPLVVGHIAMRRAPGLCRYRCLRLHGTESMESGPSTVRIRLLSAITFRTVSKTSSWESALASPA